jgi:monovalent cation:proton antiporter-2 (CPA2) family protein
MDGSISQLLVFLAAAAIAAPLGRRCGFGSIIGYLIAGIVIGSSGLAALVGKPEELHNMAELGVAMFLFLIGLELRPRRLWALRYAVFGAGGVQVVATTAIFTVLSLWSEMSWSTSLLIGLAVSLSSTAFALQTLDERGELTARHGRLAFSILLFQDIAAIPMIVLVGFLAASGAGGQGPTLMGLFKGLAVIAAIVLTGRYVLNRVYTVVASTGVREGMTASALLTIVAVVYLMHLVGMSPALGAFLAGILLADSEYRHQIESDIAPFEGLLLGLFFMTVGMSLKVDLIFTDSDLVFLLVFLIIAIKAAILYGVGIWQDLKPRSARRLALVASQGGEFAFVLLGAGVTGHVVDQRMADALTVAVTLSMMVTPLLLMADDFYTRRQKKPEPRFDAMPKKDGHVVIAGFGRYGQIVARVLRATRIPFTALDINPEQVNFVNQFGNKIYYGDASRLGILEAAMTQNARAFILAIDDVEASLRTAQIMRQHFPHVPVYARARNRQHVHQLMDMGIEMIERETFLSSMDLTKDLLRGLGMSEKRVRFIIETFKESDEKRLYDDYKIQSDLEKLRQRALKQSQELEEIFAQDVIEGEARSEAPETVKSSPAAGVTPARRASG